MYKSSYSSGNAETVISSGNDATPMGRSWKAAQGLCSPAIVGRIQAKQESMRK
jgi:hypothetical protein